MVVRLAAVGAHLWPRPCRSAGEPRSVNASRQTGEAAAARSVEFLQQLVRAQANAVDGEPCPGESAVQNLASARLAELGCKVTDMRYEPGDLVLRDEFADGSAVQTGERVSVIGHLSAVESGGRSLILFAHPDGEPVTGTELWTKDPFAADIHDGRLYGWGVADDLMGVAAGICALDVLIRCEIQPPCLA